MLKVNCNIKIKKTNIECDIEIGKKIVNKRIVNFWKKLNGRINIGQHGVWSFSGDYTKKIADRIWIFPFDPSNGYNATSYKHIKSFATLDGKQVDKFLTKVGCGKPLSGDGQINQPFQSAIWRMYLICNQS